MLVQTQFCSLSWALSSNQRETERGAVKLSCNFGACDSANKPARQQPCCSELGVKNIGLYIRICLIWVLCDIQLCESQAWMYLFTRLFGPLHHSVFHNDTKLRKQLGNWGRRGKCSMSMASLALYKWVGTAVWPHSAISQHFPKGPRQFQCLLPPVIHVQWLSLKGY